MCESGARTQRKPLLGAELGESGLGVLGGSTGEVTLLLLAAGTAVCSLSGAESMMPSSPVSNRRFEMGQGGRKASFWSLPPQGMNNEQRECCPHCYTSWDKRHENPFESPTGTAKPLLTKAPHAVSQERAGVWLSPVCPEAAHHPAQHSLFGLVYLGENFLTCL